jgi:hypothetical protein
MIDEPGQKARSDPEHHGDHQSENRQAHRDESQGQKLVLPRALSVDIDVLHKMSVLGITRTFITILYHFKIQNDLVMRARTVGRTEQVRGLGNPFSGGRAAADS